MKMKGLQQVVWNQALERENYRLSLIHDEEKNRSDNFWSAMSTYNIQKDVNKNRDERRIS